MTRTLDRAVPDDNEETAIDEIEDFAALADIGNEESLIAAFLAANPAGVDAEPPQRPTHVLPPVRRDTTPASDKLLWASRIRTEAEAGALANRPDPAMDAAVRSAEKLEAEGLAALTPDLFRQGAGGEIVPDGNGHQLPAPWRDTVAAPSLITAEASRARLDLANDCGVLSQTLDICETVGANNSLERMLAAQLALAHRVAMRAGKRADEAYERAGGAIDKKFREACSIQGQRETNAMARASAAFQSGALTLQKLRSGGKQTITVTHIQNTQVNEGGKAVVTSGAVGVPGAGSRRDGGEG